MNELYPLRFKPSFKERIWGGDSFLHRLKLAGAPQANCGEAWLISGVAGEQSVVSNGYLAGNELGELLEIYMGDLVGDRVYEEHGDRFPVLLKLLDSNDWLSLQVHPNDELAAHRYSESGKSELWYIMEASPDAKLVSGLRSEMNRSSFMDHLLRNDLQTCLNYEEVGSGDLFHIPAGRIHALGPGILLAEIQQCSDRTYRLHDWGRTDKEGRSRDLHVEQALEAIDYQATISARSAFPRVLNKANRMLEAPYFNVNFLDLTQALHLDCEEMDSFVILLCVEGSVSVEDNDSKEMLIPGECVLIPNCLSDIRLKPLPAAKVLEIYIS
jgi:mannose-6-phosphate isomerase